MTRHQYWRWFTFSARLARHGFPTWTQPRRARLERAVRHFISVLGQDSREIEDWDSGPHYVCDRIDSFIDGAWGDECYTHYDKHGEQTNKFASAISACVRAGLDVAVCPSAGVVGFSVG